MPTSAEYQSLLDRVAALKDTLADRMGPNLIENPQLADALVRRLDDLLAAVVRSEAAVKPPPDLGLAELSGIGDEAAERLEETRIPHVVEVYDETVTSERINALADLYYVFQHEKIGVFRTVLKLQELFRAGTVRLSSGDGAYRLYQFDRRQVLRYTRRERLQAYRRAFGYTSATPPAGAQPNRDFHRLLVLFVNRVAEYFRDKRISNLFQAQAPGPGFGSIAIVRRSGLDLRNNLKHASYGHINVLRVEVMQLLEEAFRILQTEDVRKLFGADNAWDVVEEVGRRYFGQTHIDASQRNRMAIAGREIMRWLAQAHILNSTRAEFEALLTDIGDDAEEWLTSAEALGVVQSNLIGPRQHGLMRYRMPEAEWETELG
jgi:hypothetical protein